MLYKLNQDYITSALCENVDVPEMQCAGKCYLGKQIKEADKKDTAPIKVLKEKNEIFYVEVSAETIGDIEPANRLFTYNPGDFLPGFTLPVFQPPRV